MSTVTVAFDTSNRREIPRVGQRKVVRVNGKPESLYVTKVLSEFVRVELWDEEGGFLGIRHDYFGEATLEPFLNVRTVSE